MCARRMCVLCGACVWWVWQHVWGVCAECVLLVYVRCVRCVVCVQCAVWHTCAGCVLFGICVVCMEVCVVCAARCVCAYCVCMVCELCAVCIPSAVCCSELPCAAPSSKSLPAAWPHAASPSPALCLREVSSVLRKEGAGRGHQEGLWRGASWTGQPCFCAHPHCREGGTHRARAFFSENTRRQKSPSLKGSKVDGTTRYSPGGSRTRPHTSRRLM